MAHRVFYLFPASHATETGEWVNGANGVLPENR